MAKFSLLVGSYFIITNVSRFGAVLLLLGIGRLLDEAIEAGELKLPVLLLVLAGVEVEVAPLGIEELPVPGESALVRLPPLDQGQGGGLVVEAEMPPPVVGTLEPVIGAPRVHRDLAEHAERAPSVGLPLGPDSDAAAPGEAEVLVALLVPVSDNRLPRVLGQGHGGARPQARVALVRAHLHCKLGFNMCGVEAGCLHQHLVPLDGEEAVVTTLGPEILTPHLRALLARVF